MDFGHEIRAARLRAGLTQGELASLWRAPRRQPCRPTSRGSKVSHRRRRSTACLRQPALSAHNRLRPAACEVIPHVSDLEQRGQCPRGRPSTRRAPGSRATLAEALAFLPMRPASSPPAITSPNGSWLLYASLERRRHRPCLRRRDRAGLLDLRAPEGNPRHRPQRFRFPARAARRCSTRCPGVARDEKSIAAIQRDGQVRLWWDDTPLDIFFDNLPIHEEAARHRRMVPFEGKRIPVLGPVELAVFKVMFDRTRDWADIEAMLEAESLDVDALKSELTELVGRGRRIPAHRRNGTTA